MATIIIAVKSYAWIKCNYKFTMKLGARTQKTVGFDSSQSCGVKKLLNLKVSRAV